MEYIFLILDIEHTILVIALLSTIAVSGRAFCI